MTDSKSVKLAFDCVGGDFERAGEASSKNKKNAAALGNSGRYCTPYCHRHL